MWISYLTNSEGAREGRVGPHLDADLGLQIYLNTQNITMPGL
jgi:hypothetical protein